jgi:pimeloyl-ACP methyl ester carboxylesterase
MNERMVRTRRGAEVRVREWGEPSRPPLVFLHGVMGLLEDATCMEALAEEHHVVAPELPGYGQSQGEELLEDMLDFSLHGWDVLDALQVHQPVLVGHSLGGMIAAEMACLAPAGSRQLVLVDPFGVWIDQQPIPDLFALLPYEFGDYLFSDHELAEKLLAGTSDSAEPEALTQFFVQNARQLGTAGKMLFPIPNRGVSKRLYRVTTPTTLVWGAADRLMPPAAYLTRWRELLPHARARVVEGAGHMVPYEQPLALAQAIDASVTAPAGR